ncbi:V-set and immunoglobulin domain-containing protein 10-like 2 [Gigantopelta aegis]|uniref:V-set and immunoglobulin domain-containing protein 10-like 2 n=1 Tax=Gigantopelta aegis TaxID=1735272 RepID=UPI001B887464|nr:V-set and immunoglobulin domain-containing protein 10-like 2 [Gigantopelta aegis]
MATLLYGLVLVSTVEYILGAHILSMDRTISVIGQPLILTYNNNETPNITDTVRFMVNTSIEGVCLRNHGRCGSGKGNHVTRISSNVIRLKIPSFNATRHAGAWRVQEGYGVFSNYLNLTPPFAHGPDFVTFSPSPPGHATEGGDLTVRCSADCYPPCDYSWILGTRQISSSSLLTLIDINRTQAGVYTCTVNNTFIPQSKGGQFSLTIFYPPSEAPVISGTVFPVFEGDVITLHCSTTGGNPKPNLTWSCPGGSTSCSDIDSGETRTCTIPFTANRSQNNVACVCTPSWQYGGYSESKSRKMVIYYPPGTPSLSPGSSHPWLEDRPDSLICSLPSGDQGNPEANFYWIRNDNDINHTGFNYTFTPSKEDNGHEYTCTAGNLFTDRDGQSRPESRPVQLIVYYSPRVTISSDKHTRVELGKLLILRCSADSNPANPTFEWTRGTTHVADGIMLQIAAFRDSDQGEYTCSATTMSTRYGSRTGSASVIVTGERIFVIY